MSDQQKAIVMQAHPDAVERFVGTGISGYYVISTDTGEISERKQFPWLAWHSAYERIPTKKETP